MSEVVLDSSILLAILFDESLDLKLADIIDRAVISTVNLAEVFSKLHEIGIGETPRFDALLAILDRIEPFTEAQARIAGLLRPQTKHVGLSLGDRACLALATSLGAEAWTTDRLWSRVPVDCKVVLVR